MLFEVQPLGQAGISLWLTLALGTMGCGGEDHPPPPRQTGSNAAPAPGVDGGVYFDDLSPELPPGALGDCGETVVALDLVRPNLYFLLDRSGSMNESIPGTFLLDRFGAARNAIELVLRDIGHRVNFGASVFPEHPQECGPGMEVHVTAPGDPVSFALAHENGPQLDSLVFDLLRITPQGVTPTSAALTGLHDTLVGLPGETFLFLLTDGAPNCNEALGCGADQCTANIEQLPYSASQVCNDSINCCSTSIFGPLACLDAQATTDAVTALHDDGVTTFVIGMPGTEAYETLLGELAQAGGAAREQEPFYYPVADSDELLETLKSLGGQVSLSCTIELNEIPPDPDRVNVFLDDTLIAYDEEEGWAWQGESTVELHGEACALATNGQVLQIQVVAGCPLILR